MASLSFIMDVNDDSQTEGRPPLNKRDRGPNKPASAGPLHEPPPFNPQPDPNHASSPGLAIPEQDIKRAVPAGQIKRRGASSRGPKSSSTAPTSGTQPSTGIGVAAIVSSSSSSSPSLSTSTARPSTSRRLSTASTDSMDRSRYGSVPSSSSGGRGLQRPVPPYPATTQYAPKITPKTGRVSKAKKGLPVHICDICRPPKTFTRAEHLRRHQLGHGAPQFQCSGCDRSFHRADLLTRHQQKHEHDGDDDMSRMDSEHPSPHPSPAALSFREQHSPGTPNPGSTASPSASELPPTPNLAEGNQQGFSQLGNSAHGSNAVYRAGPRSSSQDFHTAYTLSPTISIVNPTHPSSITNHYHGSMGGYQPRTSQPSIYVVTQGLQPPSLQQPTDLPELHAPSPNPSSATDSTFSTPISDVARIPGPWARGHRSPTSDRTYSHRLSPYPGTAPRGLQTSGPGIEGVPALQPPLFVDSFPNPPPSGHAFGATLSVPSSMAYSAASPSHHHPSLSASSTSTIRPYQHHQHQQADLLSSFRSPTPPLRASSQAGEVLITSAPSLSSHLDSMAGLDRRKRLAMEAHHGLLGSPGGMGSLDVLGLAAAYGGSSSAASPHPDNASHSSGIPTELDLALGGGCAMPATSSMTIPLPAPVRAAIPRYLDIYWTQVDPVLPLIHRQSVGNDLEDVLRCSMAAVATQNLDDREDRTRGNQLHEFAWQEVKRIPQWSLQTMQAILLCEYFARFRGRKAVTRPSKPFESLYSRVLYQNRALLDHAVLAADRDLQDRWQHWLDAESRRRLFAACYFSDGHAAIYQQQRRTQDTDGALEQVPLLGRSTKLWEASTAEEWVNILAADPGALQPDHIPPLEHLTQEDVLRRPPMDQMIILSVLAQRLPRRQRAHSLSPHTSPSPEMDPHMQYVGSQFNPDQQQQPPFHLFAPHPQADYPLDAEERINTLFPACPIANTYLALHHTPLRDLLAVGGDSWVFSQKVLPATSFLEHQKRLRLWVTATSTTTTTNTPNHSNNHSHSNSNTAPSAASAGNNDVLLATIYASRAILAFLDRELCQPQQNTTAAWSADMSDYWAMYVCALIFWAFCHPVRNGSNGTAGGGIGTEGGVDSPAVSSSVEGTTAAAASAAGGGGRDDEAAAVGWLRMVASASTVGEGPRAVEEVLRLRGRRGAGGVVGLVRRRLEGDCVGGRSRLYVDAVGVLRRIEERDGWKWF